jgi:AcrR family transcriptional regulator
MSTKELIIQVATQLFADKGYEGMKMKEIAQKVGIKTPSLYAFFESKEHILLHIYRNVLTDHLQLASSNTDLSNQSAKEQLEQILYTIMNYQLKESLRMKIYIRLLLFPPEVIHVDMKKELLKVEQEEHEMFCRIFNRGMDHGEIKRADCNALATSLICIMDGLFWEMQRYDEHTFRQRFQVVWEQFWRAIKQD